jgi:hypothetical protein
MPTHPRKHSDATQIVEEILKEAAEPRQSAPVRETLEKKQPPILVVPETLGGNKGGKTKAVERSHATRRNPLVDRHAAE